MAKRWWFPLDFRVWRTDSALRRCSMETQGLWLNVLCVMHESDTPVLTGSPEELARLIGCEPSVVMRCATELMRTGTADVTLGNGFVTLVSRRLKRELNTKESNRLRKRRERSHASVTAQSQHIVINKSNSNKKEEEKEAALPPTRARKPDLSIYEDPMILVYREFFPDASLSPHLQNEITSRVTDIPAWRRALKFWKTNDYRAVSIGKLCDRYDEEHNGTVKINGNSNRKRTDADVIAESADFYDNYPS